MEIHRSNENQYLTFRCGEELFAIGILHVKEIKGYVAPTSIPMMPKSVLGVINLRGNVLPIVDLNLRFGREKTKITRRACVVIVETEKDSERVLIGLLVDAVSEVVDIPISEIEKAPSFGAKIRNDFIESLGKIENKFVIILNINNVLSIEELSSIENELSSAVEK